MIVTFDKYKERVLEHTPTIVNRELYKLLALIFAFALTLGYAIIGLFLMTFVIDSFKHVVPIILILAVALVLYIINATSKDKEYFDSLMLARKKLGITEVILTVLGTVFIILHYIL